MTFLHPHYEQGPRGQERMKKLEVTEEEWEFLKEELPLLAHATGKEVDRKWRDVNEGSAANPLTAPEKTQELEKKSRLFRSIANKLRGNADDDTPTVH